VDGILIILILLVLMYVVVFLPRQRQLARQKAMQSALSVGDAVVTIGGIHATVAGLDEQDVVLEVSPGVEVRFVREAIARRLTSEVAATGDGDVDEPLPGDGNDDVSGTEPGWGKASS